ncbi:hypothetical protein WMF38_25650 [Sorangium sp. So ce118]
MSPRAYDAAHSIEREVEDLDVLLSRSGAELAFGLSSGAILTLEAARALPSIRKVAGTGQRDSRSPDRSPEMRFRRTPG